MHLRKKLFYLVYILLWMSQGVMLYFGTPEISATLIFFMLLAITILLSILIDFHSSEGKPDWFDFYLLELIIYNIIDEKLHRGAIFDWYEIYIAIGLFFINLTFNYRKTIWKYLFQKV